LGHAESQLALANWLAVGCPNILDKNPVEALNWVIEAAKQKLPRAEYTLGKQIHE
jgi:TPR repeat protein